MGGGARGLFRAKVNPDLWEATKNAQARNPPLPVRKHGPGSQLLSVTLLFRNVSRFLQLQEGHYSNKASLSLTTAPGGADFRAIDENELLFTTSRRLRPCTCRLAQL